MKQKFSNQINSFDAKTHFSKILQKVKNGEKITILKHNCPIAILSPIVNSTGKDINETIENLTNFRKGKKLSGIQLKFLIEEGRR